MPDSIRGWNGPWSLRHELYHSNGKDRLSFYRENKTVKFQIRDDFTSNLQCYHQQRHSHQQYIEVCKCNDSLNVADALEGQQILMGRKRTLRIEDIHAHTEPSGSVGLLYLPTCTCTMMKFNLSCRVHIQSSHGCYGIQNKTIIMCSFMTQSCCIKGTINLVFSIRLVQFVFSQNPHQLS